MKKFLLLVSFLSATVLIFAQQELVDIDSLLDKAASPGKHSLKRIKTGNRRTGVAFYYLKSSDSVYCIVNRKQFKSGKDHTDSSAEFKYFFLDDQLVKVIHSRALLNPFRYGYEYLYFHDSKLVGRKEFKLAPVANLPQLLKEAEEFLQKAKGLQKPTKVN